MSVAAPLQRLVRMLERRVARLEADYDENRFFSGDEHRIKATEAAYRLTEAALILQTVKSGEF